MEFSLKMTVTNKKIKEIFYVRVKIFSTVVDFFGYNILTYSNNASNSLLFASM